MNQPNIYEINDYLVRIFNEILLIEEGSLKQSEFSDLTIKEMHTIEAIGLSGERSYSDVAGILSVTPGTLSVSISNLIKKGYVQRIADSKDRRISRLSLTNKGRLLYRLHRKFHLKMVEDTLRGLNPDEVQALIKGLRNLHLFLDDIKQEIDA